MDKLLVTSIAAATFFVAPALSADLPTKAPAYVAPVPVLSWTGCYVGGNVGGAWGRDQFLADLPAPTAVGKPHINGGVGGGQIGCDYQSGPLVVGVEGLFDWGHVKGSAIDPLNPTLAQNDKVERFGTATARIGYAADRSLFYVKGGAAWAHNNSVGVIGGIDFPNTRTADGWTVGVGWEFMIAPNWSAKIEYGYIDLGNKFGMSAGSPTSDSWKERLNVVLVGLNYRFGGPVYSKY